MQKKKKRKNERKSKSKRRIERKTNMIKGFEERRKAMEKYIK